MIFPPSKDIVSDDKGLVKDSWLTWLKQITTGINFISPTFAGGQSGNIDFTTSAQAITPYPGFLILSYSTVASGRTATLPAAPRNSIVIIASQVGVTANVVINGTWTLTPGTWITLISDGATWTKIQGGSL